MNKRLSQKWRRTGQALIAAGLLLLLVRYSSWSEWRRIWSESAGGWWAFAAVLLTVQVVLGWLSLRLLLGTRKPLAHWSRDLIRYGAVQSIAVWTPGRVAEVLLVRSLSPGGFATGEVLAALLAQRIVTVLVSFTLAVLFGPVLFARLHGPALAPFALTAVLACLVACFPFWFRGVKWLRDVLGADVSGFSASWRSIWLKRPQRWMLSVAVLLLRALVQSLAGYCIVLSLSLQIPFSGWIAISSALNVVSLVPITVWGLGTTEGALALGLQAFHAGPEYAFSISLIARGIAIVLMLAWLTFDGWFVSRRRLTKFPAGIETAPDVQPAGTATSSVVEFGERRKACTTPSRS